MIRIAPSILSADFSRLSDEIRRAEEAGADLFHLDVMDGHFVPNLTIGPFIVKTIRKLTEKELYTHLMIEEPLRYVKAFAEAGSDTLVFHIEVASSPYRVIEEIRRAGCRVGVSLNPETPWERLLCCQGLVDTILVMTVNPGFGGQKLIEEALEKVKPLREAFPEADIAVDGGLNAENTPTAVELGATTIVAGTYIFGAGDIRGAIESLRACAGRR